MRRNFGSLNLAALDLHAPPDALAHDLADLALAADCDGNSSHHHEQLLLATSEHAVGFPIELFAQAADETATLRRRKRSFSEHAAPPATAAMTMTSAPTALPVATRAQLHHAELHALRCLSLNLMLSSSVPGGRSNSSSGGASVAVTAPQPSTSMPKMAELACLPQSDRALLAARRSSLSRNMIQSA